MTNSNGKKEVLFYAEDDFEFQMNNINHDSHNPDRTYDFDDEAETQFQNKDMLDIIEVIKLLPPQIKQYSHKNHLSELEKIRNTSDNTKGRAIPLEKLALNSMLEVVNFYEEMTGYDIRWVFELHRKATIAAKSGRKNKYSNKERQVNNFFIKLLTERDSSEKQAMKLLVKLRGNKIVTEGSIRELQNTYRDFKSLGHHKSKSCFIENYDLVVNIISNFKVTEEVFKDDDNELSYEKAITAFKQLSKEFIEIIDESFSKDDYYNDILIKWGNFKGTDIDKVFNNPAYDELEGKYDFINYCIENYVYYMDLEDCLQNG